MIKTHREKVEKAMKDIEELRGYATPMSMQTSYEQRLAKLMLDAFEAGELVWRESK